LKKLLVLAMAAVCVFLLFFPITTKAQVVALDECYGGVEFTRFGVYDPEIGDWVELRVRCLPWWWDPLYLPPAWVILTPAIVPVLWYDVGYVGGFFTFGDFYYYPGYYHHFHRFHSHFWHFRHHLHGTFDRHFRRGMVQARERYPGLKKPSGFQHAKQGTRGDHRGEVKQGFQKDGKHPQVGGPAHTGKASEVRPPGAHGKGTGPAPGEKIRAPKGFSPSGKSPSGTTVRPPGSMSGPGRAAGTGKAPAVRSPSGSLPGGKGASQTPRMSTPHSAPSPSRSGGGGGSKPK